MRKILEKIKDNLKENKWIYISFLCFGLFVGALLVDMAGVGDGKVSLKYLSGSAGSVFQSGSKTWVSYNNPIVEMTVLNDLSCKICNPAEEVASIKQNISPTIISKDLDFSSEGGEMLVDLFHIKTVPAFIFSSNIAMVSGFDNIKHLFKQEGSYYLLDSAKVGIEPRELLNFSKEPNAKITILEISDYQCPYCKRAAGALKEALKDYSSDEVRIIHKHLPLDFHEFSESAAIAAECARQQGREYFERISDAFFESQFNSDKEIRRIAKKNSGMDYKKWETCYDYESTKNIVDGDKAWANSLGISGTPMFIINGKFYSGAQSADKFREIINEELGS